MITIHLRDLKFFAYHGVNEEESITGSEFIVDASVTFHDKGSITHISETVDYVKIYEIISDNMRNAHRLLESLAIKITEDIRLSDEKIKKINISIFKINPPLSNFSGNLGITYSKEF
jgi:dihydroneopterin aldolase